MQKERDLCRVRMEHNKKKVKGLEISEQCRLECLKCKIFTVRGGCRRLHFSIGYEQQVVTFKGEAEPFYKSISLH